MKAISRRQFVKSALAASVAAAARAHGEKSAAPSRPNVLWITMEDTSPLFLGCYGNPGARTPNMDRLAAEGVRFTSAFSTAPVCAPSRCAIFTGCTADRLGTGHHRSTYPIPGAIKGFPHYLRQAGYYTTNNDKTDYNVGGARDLTREAWDQCFGAGGWGTSYADNSDTFDENSAEAGWWHRNPGQPFFSVFNLFNSHQSRTMTYPDAWYREKVLNGIDPSRRVRPDRVVVPPFYADTPKMREHLARVYNSLQAMDMAIGGIMGRLEKDGLRDDTIVFCFADHGEAVPRGKTSALALGFQVPFLLYVPRKFGHLCPWRMGDVTEDLVSSSEDVAPSVLAAADVDIPAHMTGRPLLGRTRTAPRTYAWGARDRIDESPDLSRVATDGRWFYTRVFMPQFPEVKFMKYGEVGEMMRTIRDDYANGRLNQVQRSLIRPAQAAEYLFDLRRDPWQVENLVGDPSHATELARFRDALQEHLQQTRDIHFMPEFEMARLARARPPFEIRKDDGAFPFARILAAANRVGAGAAALPEQLRLLGDPDPTVRYWAAVGLDAQSEPLLPYRERILPALRDTSPPVQIVAAALAWRTFQNEEAQEILSQWIRKDDRKATLLALQMVENFRERSRPFAGEIRALLERHSENEGDVICSISQVILHYLNGDPLYLKAMSAWIPEAEKQTDKAIRFA